MHNDHGQFDTRSPLKSADLGVRAKPKWPLLAAAGVGGAVVGSFIPLGLIESVTTATGLSEMIPALAPPLGSTMRIMLALGGGVSMLALAAMFLGGRSKAGHMDNRAPRFADDHRAVPLGVRMEPNARPDFDADYSQTSNPVPRNNGESPMARHANVRRNIDDYDAEDARNDRARNDGAESGGFFSRMKASLSKLPLPRRFEDDGDVTGPIRDFSDLKRLRPGGEDRREAANIRAEMPVRPIAAHAELGEPLPPVVEDVKLPVLPILQPDLGDDLAELERSARAVTDRFSATNPQPTPEPFAAPAPAVAPVLDVATPAYAPPEAAQVQPAPAPTPVQQAATPRSIRMPAPAPVSYDAEGIDALVARLEQALAHVRPMAVAAAPEEELDLTAFIEAQRLADEAEAYHAAEEARDLEQHRAEEARILEQHRAEEARQAQLAIAAEAKRRTDALAAQDAARKAAEEADRAAVEARRRAEEAQALLASLGVEQAAPVQSVVTTPTPLRAVAPSVHTAVEPEMDDALRSALRTLRRMSNP